ncbi:MAG: glycerophosphodiester phosphodiesterase family protein [Cryobacterium sp.]
MGAAPPSGYLAPGGVRVLAHQGLARSAPPNTLLAFLAALSTGATHLETDVHVTLDDIAVISHDPVFRNRGRNVRISQLTFLELAGIRLADGQAVPSLAEALTAFPDARFNIDVKVDGAVAATIRSVRDCGATDRVLITSFSQSRRRAAVVGLPGVASSPSSAEFTKVLASAQLGSSGLTRRLLQGFVAVQVPERAGPLHLVTERFVRRMHAAGAEVHVWTVNDPRAMTRLLDLGVDGIVTDRCDLLSELLSART